MFEARLVQGSLLKTVLEGVKDLHLNEATFECSKEGIKLQTMDHSHVSLMTVNMRADCFDKFRCDRTISMRMDLTEMSKILKNATGKDIITIKVEDQTETVTFTFESPNKRKVTPSRCLTMKMKLTKYDQGCLGIPEHSYSAVIKMPSGEFQRVVRELSQFDNRLVINCVKEVVKFSAVGNNGIGNIKLAQCSAGDEEEAVVIRMNEPVLMTFATRYLNMFIMVTMVTMVLMTFGCRYLNMFTNASRWASQVSLCMSPDRPMAIEYKIAEIGHVRFYLAPMVEDKR